MISNLIKLGKRALGWIAKKVVQKYKPFIVGVTGTVGKTTTTHYIADFLEKQFPGKVYISPFSYNGEIGVPLSILGMESPKKNIFLWIVVLFRGILLLLITNKSYPKYLVLEYGIDTPGEMKFLLSVAQPDIGFLTNISSCHLEQFGTLERYAEEKILILESSKIAFYNADDYGIRDALASKSVESYQFYGVRKKSGLVSAGKIQTSLEGTTFEVQSEENKIQVEVPVIGSHTAYNILPVFCVALTLGIDPFSVAKIFTQLHPQKGRGSLLNGINDTYIIDGSYNGGFQSISTGLEFLDELKFSGKKYILLGDMRELGTQTADIHVALAQKIIDYKFDGVYLVGNYMEKYVSPLLTNAEITHHTFLSSRAAGRELRSFLTSEEGPKVLYVKGSQNTLFLEEAIKEILLDISDADKLCRQSADWIEKKQIFFETVVADK